jgi:hypothetical protein
VTEHRPEHRQTVEIPVRVYGMDANGRTFSQVTQASDLSHIGARLSALDHPLKVGDSVGVVYGENKVRCSVIWIIDAGPVKKISVGVRLVDGQACPWQALLSVTAGAAREERRRFARFPAAMRIEAVDQEGKPVWGHASDISATGCYITTLQPLPCGTRLEVRFWLAQEKFTFPACVRTSHSGVGMGIEFVGLADHVRAKLDDHLRCQKSES